MNRSACRRVDLPAFPHLVTWEVPGRGHPLAACPDGAAGALVFCRRRRSLAVLDAISWRLLRARAAGTPEPQVREAASNGAGVDIARRNAATLADPARPLPDLPFRPARAAVERRGPHAAPVRVQSFAAAPVAVRVAFHGPARDAARAARLLRQVADTMPPAQAPATTVELTAALRAGAAGDLVLPDGHVIRCANLRQLAGAVVGAAFEAAHEALAYRFRCHGAAVRFRGVDWLLPAPSGAGKTTLAKALIDRGGVCWSDDVIAFDPAFRPLPSGAPLVIKAGAWRAAGVDAAGLPVLERPDGRRFVLYWPPGGEGRRRDAGRGAGEDAAAGQRPAPAAVVAPRFAPGEALSVQPLALPGAVFALTRDGYRQRRIDRGQDTIDFIDHLAALPACGIRYGACDSVVTWMKEQAARLCGR